ncbi:MAG: hypothetical protein ACRCTL_00620 [Pseudomonas sp.]
MIHDEVLWIVAWTALLTAPLAIILYVLWCRIRPWLSRQLPPRHMVARGLRVTRQDEEGQPHE